MKKVFLCICILLAFPAGLMAAKFLGELAAEKLLPRQPAQTAVSAVTEWVPETTEVPQTTVAQTAPPAETATEPPVETTEPYLLTFTEEEEELLLKLGMSERGNTGCVTCMALVMRTALNRVESPKFSSTVKGVIYAQDQFTPVMDGTFETADPDWFCRQALELVKQGWDESQGALYYEWCEGPSWHSQNLNLLLQHCDTRFYN